MLKPTGLSLLAAIGLMAAAVLAVTQAGHGEAETVLAQRAEPQIAVPPARPEAPAEALPSERVVPEGREGLTLSYAPVVRRVVPAVVNIYANRVVQGRQASPFFDDPFFRRFFGDIPGRSPDRVQQSLGSGVIVDATGLIVTNHHVINGATEVRVALHDRREFEAEVVVDDEKTDLAVLRIDAGEALPALEFDDSEALEVGDLVLAIGNPFGVGQTVTSGIISATSRTKVGVGDYGFFLQTDAAINPGNSGGALVDMRGRLVGINTAIFSRSGGSHGIGFAIPSNMVRLVVSSAENGGAVERPWFGGSLQAVTSDIAESIGLDRPRGCIVGNVYPGSPAERAGLRTGDVVVAVDGGEVSDPSAFGYRFATRGIGGTADLTILRDGREETVAVALMPAPEDPPRDLREIGGSSPFAGATVGNLSPKLAEELGLEPTRRGVVVVGASRGTIANRVGLRPRDVILQVNGQRVDTTATLERMAAGRPGRWELSIERDGRVISTVLRG
ncbi:Do family serine endopeptidase [Lutibaculum baratangense]|uniref:Peptidase S1C, Do n=1 Tax=Lutibaculum baratangense AMV1 TaxID=631454 RepID=V4RTX1_9HYPH|nr:Do family serine endopeptidase [Lutibaculum baratangense]ESR26540.1 peptidase S1C, Do [Lutibaculum baratangense AMV1]